MPRALRHGRRPHPGRFLTILPRSRKEDEVGRAWIVAGEVTWQEVASKPGKRKGGPDEVYWAAEASGCSVEGFRISLPMYHEGRPCAAPTAARVIELLEPLSATAVLHAGELLAISPPEPDALRRQILSLLKVPLRAYGIEQWSPRYSR